MINASLLSLRQCDCLDGLREIPSSSVDLIFTSPPYAERRKKHYSGQSPEAYASWFLPIAIELRRVLKPTGSFLLNLKSHCEHGERHLYVMELVIALKRLAGFTFVDEYVWYKSAAPRKKCYRLKDAWEPIYHFGAGKGSQNYINHEAIKIASDATFTNKRGYTCFNDVTNNIGGYHDIADQTPGFTDPPNVFYFPTSLLVKDAEYAHPAKFPLELASFIVKAFCPKGGLVCDPFVGSGMTALASLIEGNQCLAFELEQEYCEMVEKRIRDYRTPEQIHRSQGWRDIFE